MTSVIAGLNSVEASRRLAVDGPNQLPQPRQPSALRHFGKQFTHLLAVLLWVASGLAVLAGQPALAVAIIVVIVLNAIFAFAQEYRADRSAARLRSMLPMSAPDGLTDNVAELAPFAAWALTGGKLPLAIGVLQVLALDIGTDMLPALALGAEPPNRRIMSGRTRQRSLIDRRLLFRALLILGVTEAVCALATFVAVLSSQGWALGVTPAVSTLAIASGSAFAAIALGQMANAFACRSETQPVWRQRLAPTDFSLGRSRPSLSCSGYVSASRRLLDFWVAPGRPHLAGRWRSAPFRS